MKMYWFLHSCQVSRIHKRFPDFSRVEEMSRFLTEIKFLLKVSHGNQFSSQGKQTQMCTDLQIIIKFLSTVTEYLNSLYTFCQKGGPFSRS